MKLCNFQKSGKLYAGTVEEDRLVTPIKTARGTSGQFPTVDALVSSGFFEHLEERQIESGTPLQLKEVTLLPPILHPPTIFNLGLVFMDHVSGRKHEYPKYPVVSLKPSTSLVGSGDEIVLPKIAPNKVCCAVELCVVISKSGRHIPKNEAMDYIAGYTVFNDVVARIPGTEAPTNKIFDTFSPTGPYLVTRDEIPDPGNLELSLIIDGELKEKGNTKEMIFDIPTILSFMSDILTLEPGDIIATGEPGYSTDELHNGSVVECKIERVGVLRNMAKVE